MKNKIKILAGIILSFTIEYSYAQWTKINSIPSQEMVGLAALNNTVFAASGSNILYRSTDAGVSWSSLTVSDDPVENFSLKIIDKNIYVGTISNGIFCSTDFGVSWKNWKNINLPVTGFEKFGARLYASTMGSGVFFYDNNSDTWLPFNSQLPNYSFNVTSITSTSNNLIIGAGGNGTFYTYDFILNEWTEKYYYGGLLPGLMTDDITTESDTLIAVSGSRIIRSENGGSSWADDKTGTHKGFARGIYSGADKYYTLTNLLAGGTWIQERHKQAPLGSSWLPNEELINGGYSYDIIEFKSRMFLARADGLYFKERPVGVETPVNNENQVRIFPNPSNGKRIKVVGSVKMDNIIIRDLLGKTIYSEPVLDNAFEIQQSFNSGVYMVTIVLSGNRIVNRKLVIE